MSIHFIKVPHVDEERLDDELILLNSETLQIKVLNETATVLWDALGEFPAAHDLAGLLVEARPEISAADGLGYVTTLLGELADAGLVEQHDRPDMTRPSVTVVIPSYNHSRYIGETLESVFRQTRRPQEVHVIDDGSTDDSVEVIERAFANAGPTRCSLTARENRGISATRNELWAATTTEFVAFLDSDDLYAPNRLERMLEGAPHGGLYFAFSGVDLMSEQRDEIGDILDDEYQEMLGYGMSLPTAGFALLRSNVALSTSNFFMSRGLLDAVGGFDDRITICQDWDFAVRALRFVEPTFIPEPLLTYRIHSRNTSRIAREGAESEQDLVIEKLSKWILQPTLNSRAPTPRNWPRYFRIFAHLKKHRSEQTLAAQLPPEILARSSETATLARETKAIRDLVSAARFPVAIKDLPRNDLMRRCQNAWAVLP